MDARLVFASIEYVLHLVGFFLDGVIVINGHRSQSPTLCGYTIADHGVIAEINGAKQSHQRQRSRYESAFHILHCSSSEMISPVPSPVCS